MEVSRRQVLRGVFWGRRGVFYLLVILGMGVIGRYDDIRSVITFLPEPSGIFSAVPSLVWFILGLVVVALIVFEGAYRYIRNIPKSVAQSDRLAELRYKESRKERDRERQRRVEIYGDISSLLKQSRETVIPLAMIVDISSVPQEKIDEVTQYIVENYIEGKHHPLDFTQQELREDIRRAMEIRGIGIELLRSSKTEIGQILNALNVKCSNVRNVQLKDLIADFRDLTITQSCLELYARFLKSHKNTLFALPVLKGREYWLDKIDTLQVKINALVDKLLKLEDWK